MKTRTLEQVNAYLESKLAVYLAMKPELFPAVGKLSRAIVKFLRTNKAAMREKITGKDLEAFKNELYVVANREKDEFRGPLGALVPSKPIAEITIDEALTDMESSMLSESANLINLFSLFSVFGFRVLKVISPFYSNIETENAKHKKMVETFKEFVKRKAEDRDILVTKQFGIVTHAALVENLNADKQVKALLAHLSVPEHRTSLARFAIDTQSGKFNEFIKHNLPLAAGPSSHTISLFTAVTTLEKHEIDLFSKDELHELSIAYSAYLTTAGYHSLHEVWYVAASILGIKHDMVNYLNNFPNANQPLYAFAEALLSTVNKECESLEYVLFDIGGVLLELDSKAVLESVFPDRDSTVMRQQTFLSNPWKKFDKGDLDEDSLIVEIARDAQLEPGSLKVLLQKTKEGWKMKNDTFSLLEELHRSGYKLFAVTNMPTSFQAYFHERFPQLWDKFAGIFVSSDIRICKPDSRFYDVFLSKYNIPINKAVFIDDRSENLDYPKSLGMQTIHFQSADQCRRSLMPLISKAQEDTEADKTESKVTSLPEQVRQVENNKSLFFAGSTSSDVTAKSVTNAALPQDYKPL